MRMACLRGVTGAEWYRISGHAWCLGMRSVTVRNEVKVIDHPSCIVMSRGGYMYGGKAGISVVSRPYTCLTTEAGTDTAATTVSTDSRRHVSMVWSSLMTS